MEIERHDVRRARDRRGRRRPAGGDRRRRARRPHGAGLQVAARQGAHGDGRGRRSRPSLGNVAPDDNWQVHFQDTMFGGKYLNNWRMAELHAKEAPDRVRELEQWGGVFDRTPDRKMSQRAFGGHTYSRLVHIGDRTGLELIRTLQDKAVHAGIDVFMECTITRLLKDGERVAGAFGYRRATGRVRRVRRAGGRPRHRRRRQVLAHHVELVGVHRRRARARLRGGRGARSTWSSSSSIRPGWSGRRASSGCSSPRRCAARAASCATPTASGSWSATTRSGSSSRRATSWRARSTRR